jgi:hypothetical protein
MTEIIKCYLDIGCSYQGDDAIENIYKDIENWNIKDCGIISMLKLKINTEKRKSEVILFKQILGPMYKKFKCSILDYRKYSSCILKEFKDVDLFVTFNGRDFDIPIIVNNLNLSDKQKEYWKEYILKKDRDLLDSCILRYINVKGGLRDIIKRLNICNNLTDSLDESVCLFNDFDQQIYKYNSNLIARKRRNESDIKVLPLLEEKLGFLYEPRTYIDKYHKKWI